MAEITLPDLSLIWSSAGDILQPSDSKIQSGWAAEIPPRQWFNWLDNRQDQAIAHIAQHGIAVWSDSAEYQPNKSYVQGSNGSIYKSLTVNTNVDPVTDSGTNWTIAFASLSDVYTKAQVDSKTTIASTVQAQAQSNNTNLITPLRLFEAFQGSNQNLSAASGYQKLPGGLILQWGLTAGAATNVITTVSFPVSFTTAVFGIQMTYVDASILQPATRGSPHQVGSFNLSSFNYSHAGTGTGAQHFWWALGR